MSERAPQRHQDLEDVIDAVTNSYDGPEEINNLDSAALPNKRAVIEAFQCIKPVLYMGFYSARGLNRVNLRYGISEHLYPAREILIEQIERAVRYDESVGRGPKVPTGWSEEVVLHFLGCIPELRKILNTDVKAAYEGDPAAASIEEVVFSYPSIDAITAYRVAHVLYQHKVPMIPRIITEHAHSSTGIDIHPAAKIGERFFIDHGTGVVIGETAVIGDNVKVYQGVTLGALSVSRGEIGGSGWQAPSNDRGQRHDLCWRFDSRRRHSDRSRVRDRGQCLADQVCPAGVQDLWSRQGLGGSHARNRCAFEAVRRPTAVA